MSIRNFKTKLKQILQEKSSQELFSGVISIKQNETPLFQEAYGKANRTWNIKNQLDTRFRIASISKMFTAIAILQLIEQKKLTLETSVIECLQLQKTKIPKEATVYHLLTMTSGIKDWLEESSDGQTNWDTLCREYPIYLLRQNQDYLPLFVNEEPVANIGEKYQYNGAGYILLGLLIEKITGESYFDAIRKQIFKRAGMKASDFISIDGIDNKIAEGYIPVTSKNETMIGWKKNIYSITPTAAADGGATSTIEDLSRFIQALQKNQLLSSKITKEMLSPKVLEDSKPFRGYFWKYGYGSQFLLNKQEEIIRWGHTGEEEGASCRLYYYPQQKIEVLILANQSGCAGNLGWQIHDLMLAKS